jgi:chitodextrinase
MTPTVLGGTATATADYSLVNGSWSWADGETGVKTITVNIVDDGLVEGNETVQFAFGAPTGGATLGSPTFAVLTITDNDSPASIPGTPTITSITTNSAMATWGASSGSVTGYRYSLNNGVSWTPVGPAVTTASLTGLTHTTNYTFQVQAVDSTGIWTTSASASFTTAVDTAPTAPGTPTFSAITGTSATASWTAASDNGSITAYQYRRNGGAWIPVGNVLSVSITGLTSYTTHSVEVQAQDNLGQWGAVSGAASFTTLDITPPLVPLNVSVWNIANTSSTFGWFEPTDNVGVTNYRYSINGGASWSFVAATLQTMTVPLTGLAAGTTYTAIVQAGDAAGNWSASASSTFTTLVGGTDTFVLGVGQISQVLGYQSASVGTPIGSLTPTTTSDGKTIVSIISSYDTETFEPFGYFQVQGFSSDPGAAWLQSLQVGSVLSGLTATYTYSGGTALWWWNEYVSLDSGPIAVVHQ